MTTLHEVLNKQNADPRDANIDFFEQDHKYVIKFEPETKYTSVTTWVHHQFPKFNADVIIDTLGGTWSWFNGSIYDNGYNNRNP